MEGAGPSPPVPLAKNAAVNGDGSTGGSPGPRKMVKKKKPGSSLFMSTNNRSQAHWQNKQLKRPAAFQELETGNARGGASTHPTRAQDAHEQIKTPKLATQLKDVPPQERVSGFSDPRVHQPGYSFRDYKLVTTKRDLLKNLRHHLMQLAGSDPPDLNSEEFTKPARLHRRNVNAELLAQPEAKPDATKSELDADQKVELLNRKEQRAREREANLAQVAPSTSTAKKTNNFKGVQQVFRRTDFTEEDKRLIQTNYEEALPWVLEDYDAKHSFVGHNHLGAYGVHVGFAYEPATESRPAHFRLIPIEKTYEFRPKAKVYNTMSIEDIMKSMKRGAVDPAWLKEYEYRRAMAAENEKAARQAKGLYTGEGRGRVKVYNHGRTEDADLDFEEDFADDEEGNLFGDDEDEDEKDVKKRVKEEQLQANFFNNRDEAEDDLVEQLEERQAEARRKFGKDYRKALERREGNYNHGSDSEGMTETDSEEERQRLEQEKLKNAKKEEDGAESRKSGLSSGANTPSGRKEKHGSGREDGSHKSRKRPGSPNLSDASGTDASVARRKKRKSNHLLSSHPTPGSSRPGSPDNLDPSSAAAHRPPRAPTSNAAGSDTDGGAMSDATRTSIKLKLKKDQVAGQSAPPSRSGSPVPRPPSTSPPSSAATILPTPEEIARALPPGGISYKDLLNVFPALRTSFRNPATKPDVLKRVKAAGQTQAGRVYPFGEPLPPVQPPAQAPAGTSSQ
ncbi:hypothetical protein DV735_g5358, partial [Chaetothyriales sp. CBS 134920]